MAAVVAVAQPAKTGTIRGTVVEKGTKHPAIGVTVVMTSPDMVGEQVAVTDERGAFAQSNLPVGTYTLTYYFASETTTRSVVVKAGGVVTVAHEIATAPPRGDVIEITANASAPFTMTAPGMTLKRDDGWSVTVAQSNKPAFKVDGWNEDHGMKLPDGTMYTAVKVEGEDCKVAECFDIILQGKLGKIARIYFPSGEIEIAGRPKRLKFDAKGVLVGTKTKITLAPAKLGRELETLMTVVALLRDKV